MRRLIDKIRENPGKALKYALAAVFVIASMLTAGDGNSEPTGKPVNRQVSTANESERDVYGANAGAMTILTGNLWTDLGDERLVIGTDTISTYVNDELIERDWISIWDTVYDYQAGGEMDIERYIVRFRYTDTRRLITFELVREATEDNSEPWALLIEGRGIYKQVTAPQSLATHETPTPDATEGLEGSTRQTGDNSYLTQYKRKEN